jgi:heptosyltransferase-2
MTGVSVDRVCESAITILDVDHLQTTPVGESERMQQPSPARTPLSGYTVFLDRDGTLNPDPGYIRSSDQYELFSGVPEALAKLKEAGARLIVITNQSGIARGLLSIDELEGIHQKLKTLLKDAGAALDAIYFCPHHPDERCLCRKPNTGMIDQALRDGHVDLGRSYVIGDHAKDMELAKRIGARSILVTTGSGPHERVSEFADSGPHRVASSLTEAADWILSDAEHRC